MTTALDTNVLLRYVEPTSPHYPATTAALAALRAAGERLVLFPQAVYEFWAAATRPLAANGLGLSAAACRARLDDLRQVFDVLPDPPDLFAEWEALVTRHHCTGRVSYDARIAAAARTHGLSRLLTFNGADFACFPGLTVLDPAVVAATPTGSN